MMTHARTSTHGRDFAAITSRVLLALCLVTALGACGGGGGGGGSPAPVLGLSVVAPAGGPAAGGTALTLTGTNFIAGATVTVGGTPATSVVVVNTTEITCVTPARTPGAPVDVAVTTSEGTVTLPAAFTYFPLPTLALVTQASGTTAGGSPVTLTGTGFLANGAGSNAVTFGGVPATSIVTVSDTSITCATPAGAAATIDVAVTNANGSVTLVDGFTYFAPVLYAADGRAGASGNLYTIDPSTGAATVVGAIGFAVTGLAISENGSLFGSVSGVESSTLIRIDTTTGAGTVVGTMENAAMASAGCTDLTFRQRQLLGWGRPTVDLSGRLLELVPATAVATDLGGTVINSGGNALAADAADVVRVVTTVVPTSTLSTVDPATGITTTVGPLVPDPEVVNAMTTLDGTHFIVTSSFLGGTTNDLSTLDVSTGAWTVIGPLPVDVDAIVGSVK